MALTEIKCPNCGANIVADNAKESVSCIFCHAVFTFSSENDDSVSKEEKDLLMRAETFLTKLHRLEDARVLFEQYALNEPQDYRGWWGIARSYSDDFTSIKCDQKTLDKIEENVKYALSVAGDNAAEMESIWEEYKCHYALEPSALYQGLEGKKREEKAQKLLKRSLELQKEIDEEKEKLEIKDNKYKPPTKKQKNLAKAFFWVYGIPPLAVYGNDFLKRKSIEKKMDRITALEEEKIRVDQEYEKLINNR